MATGWIQRGNLTGPQGTQGVAGADGTSVTTATINASGDLILTLSTGGEINAGRAKGEAGGGIDFEASVATVADLPATAPYGEGRYVRDVGHLYVFEAAADRIEGTDGWTDVGAIRGETGATGPAGADGAQGVSVTGASIDGAGHLILTLSAGGPLDAGVARGADGATGPTGPAGADGTDGNRVHSYSTTPPDVASVAVGDLAIGANGDLLEAI